jgi:hypothetical protein
MDNETRPETPAKRLRGRHKIALILDLADGALGHEELAARHGISRQGVAEFASRNRDRIEATKQDLTSELRGLWVVDKQQRLSDAEQDLEDLEERLQDPDLSHAARARYLLLKMKLRHNIAEECGQLYTRTHAEVEVTAPFRLGDVLAFGADGQLHEVVDPQQEQQ